MRATHLRIGSAPIPFRVRFSHAAAERAEADNVLVHAEDAHGHVGLGEGCPRPYVTGETVADALAFLQTHQASLQALEDLNDLRAWTAEHAADIDAHPSAFCAAELALIDLYARQAGLSIEALLGVTALSSPLTTSAVIGTGSALQFRIQAGLYGLLGMHDAKLKLTGQTRLDLPRAQRLARRGRLRLDANNLWHNTIDALPPLTALAQHAWAIEEPIAPRDWEGLRRIHHDTGLAIILDESFTRLHDLQAAPADTAIVPNLRVSKLGGLLRSLDCLRETTGPVIVGAQVGETSVLARAGLVLAQAAGHRLCGYEGAYGRLLLRHDVVRPCIGFGRHGAVSPAPWSRLPGAGLTPQPTWYAALKPRGSVADSAELNRP